MRTLEVTQATEECAVAEPEKFESLFAEVEDFVKRRAEKSGRWEQVIFTVSPSGQTGVLIQSSQNRPAGVMLADEEPVPRAVRRTVEEEAQTAFQKALRG